MEEKKLTDEEIVKAYEHCYVNDGICGLCCLSDEDKLCVSHEDVLDLINRQKAEIERLTEENKNLEERNRILKKYKSMWAELQKQVDELKERLVGEKLVIECKAPAIKDCPVAQQAVKDTAKEIFQELYNQFSSDYINHEINNLKDWKYADFIVSFAKDRYGVEVNDG